MSIYIVDFKDKNKQKNWYTKMLIETYLLSYKRFISWSKTHRVNLNFVSITLLYYISISSYLNLNYLLLDYEYLVNNKTEFL